MNTIKLTIRGIPVEVSTAADAFELIRLSEAAGTDVVPQAAHASNNGRTKPPAPPHIFDTFPDPQTLRLTAEFLRAIQSGGQAGVGTDRIVSALGVSHGRGIGGRLAIINKLLEEQGFSRDVYSNKKTANGRIWKARRSIDAAISTIDQRLKTLQ